MVVVSSTCCCCGLGVLVNDGSFSQSGHKSRQSSSGNMLFSSSLSDAAASRNDVVCGCGKRIV